MWRAPPPDNFNIHIDVLFEGQDEPRRINLSGRWADMDSQCSGKVDPQLVLPADTSVHVTLIIAGVAHDMDVNLPSSEKVVTRKTLSCRPKMGECLVKVALKRTRQGVCWEGLTITKPKTHAAFVERYQELLKVALRKEKEGRLAAARRNLEQHEAGWPSVVRRHEENTQALRDTIQRLERELAM